jgi:hypothetical protein
MAAPMVGGLITSALLTLEIIPVVYTYWRQEQLLWERLAELDPRQLASLRLWTWTQAAGWTTLVATAIAPFYLELPAVTRLAAFALSAIVILISGAGYLRGRAPALRLVWPSSEMVSSDDRSAALSLVS